MAATRTDLELMHGAGIHRARFSAFVEGITQDGHAILHDVASPIGQSEHLWADGPLKAAVTGKQIEFLASIRPYSREDGSGDFTLTALELI